MMVSITSIKIIILISVVLLERYLAIQIIDFSILNNNNETSSNNDESLASKRRIESQIDKALREDGLFIVINHGISQTLLNESLNASYELFNDHTTIDKNNLAINNSTSFGRGYIAFGHESGLSSYFEPKEGYSYGNPTAGVSSNTTTTRNLLTIQNKWPITYSNNSIHQLNTLFHEKARLAKLISNSLSNMFLCDSSLNTSPLSLNNENLFNITQGGEDISILRMFHYYNIHSNLVKEIISSGSPSASSKIERNRNNTSNNSNSTTNSNSSNNSKQWIGSSPHTDWGFLTILFADDIRGLQFLPRNKRHNKHNTTNNSNITTSTSNNNISHHQSDLFLESLWEDVPYIPGGLVVNGGDYLALISEGLYYSPIHRVRSPDNEFFLINNNSNSSYNNTNNNINNANINSNISYNSSYNSGSIDNFSGRDTINTTNNNNKIIHQSKDRYSFVFFFYPAYNYPVSNKVLNHCCHKLMTCNNKNKNNVAITADDNSFENTPSFESDNNMQYINNVGSISSSSSIMTKNVNYNTLISSSKSTTDNNTPLAFGDYIIKKWMDVYRH